MADDAARAFKAIEQKDYPAAVAHLTKALTQHPNSPKYFIDRSTAFTRWGKYEEALADAESGVLAAIARSQADKIAAAQLRRGVALYNMGRYGDARLCFRWCMQRNEKEKGLTMWLAKVKNDYDNAGGEEAECNKCTVKEIPTDPKIAAAGEKKPETESQVDVQAKAPSAPVATPKIRQDWLQSHSKVTITIYAKGVDKNAAKVNIEEREVEVSFPIGETGATYDFTASPLFESIDPAQSKFSITPYKIEIELWKAKQGLKWSAWESTEPVVSKSVAEDKKPVPAAVLDPVAQKAPAYPTSSRGGPKDWDALAKDALRAERKVDDSKGVAGDDDDDDDDDFEDDSGPDAFFKKIFKGGDPDTKRAMMKSFQESNGTALSTDWASVSKGPVETVAPDGAEAKKW